VAEGEEEIGSPHFRQVVRRPEVSAALKRCTGIFMPAASQDPDGTVTVSLGAKGVVELELVASGETWGRGPAKDIHSSLKAMVDSPAWHLIKALDTLVSADGNTITIDNYPRPRPISDEERAMIAAACARRSEAQSLKQYGVLHWIDDLPWEAANERLESQPTVNIEGLVGGYTGPGGKTVLPHRAVAKLDLRLVPDMTAADSLAKLKAHLAKHGFGDVLPLARYFLGVYRQRLGAGEVALDAQAEARLLAHAWPGNIRELENAVERGVLMARTKFIEARDLGIEVKDSPDLASLREARNRAERNALVDALAKTRGNITQGARLLAVSRPTLHGLIGKYQVNARDFR